MHFTYESTCNRSELSQGDILKRTPELDDILSKTHPQFHSKTDNKYFAVLTQSCDLVRRDNAPCKIKYITLAAVRSLKSVVDRKADSMFNGKISKKLRIINQGRQVKVEQFLERLLNNNEDDYFYLHRYPENGLIEDHCIYLRLSVPLKSELHYDALLGAKVIQLTDSFQHKLGYLIGSRFSKIGTQDWVPDNVSKEVFQDMKKRLMKDIFFVDDRLLPKIERALKSLPDEQVTLDKFKELMVARQSEQETNRGLAYDEIERILEIELNIDSETAKKARWHIQNSAIITGVMK